MLHEDLRRKALLYYGSARWSSVFKVLFSDGTLAMVFYRLMQASRRFHLKPLEMVFNKLNTVCCNCIIGRGAEFGSGLVLIHATGTVINGRVRGGSNVYIEHQVTIGETVRGTPSPIIGNNVFIGAGAKIIGPVTIGDGARVGANAVVAHDVEPYTTVIGIPARVVRRREPSAEPVMRGMALPDDPEPSANPGEHPEQQPALHS
jgi:serine O-acetyltransferase